MYSFYLGIDLHLKRTYIVLMDVKGEEIVKGRIWGYEAAEQGHRIHKPSFIKSFPFRIILLDYLSDYY